MEIHLKEISIRELTDGYQDNEEGGVVGYGGKLDIRPPYQREFIYKGEQREAVIDTVTKDFPLNVMYWAIQKDGKFEMLDGQQRTISICQYVNNDFSHKYLNFNNLQDDQREQILNYKLTIYQCEGKGSEKLEWFKTINIAGEKLSDQELRNAVYAGQWVSHARLFFSKTGCTAYSIGSNYLKGTPIRQDYLETTIKWISDKKIEDYMGQHQHAPNSDALRDYFEKVIDWVKAVFPKYRKEMKGLAWGDFYNEFKNKKFYPAELEIEISKLMQDEDVQKKNGIYEYLLKDDEKYLKIRAFTPNQKREAYEKQKGICTICKQYFELDEMEADHITPWHKNGKTTSENCQMLCKYDNRSKASK